MLNVQHIRPGMRREERKATPTAAAQGRGATPAPVQSSVKDRLANFAKQLNG
jgi:hypothetical protein